MVIDGSAAKLRTSTKEALNEAVRARATQARATATKDEIQSNPVYQIMTNPELSPEAKRDAIVAAIRAASTREDSEARDKALTSFVEHVSAVSRDMQKQIMSLVDTEVMAEVKNIIDGLNTFQAEWSEEIQYFIDVLSAVYELRTNGKMEEAHSEIRKDRKDREANRVKRDLLDKNFRLLEDEIRKNQDEIASLGEDRAFFGFGGVKQSARQDIARREVEIGRLTTELSGVQAALVEVGTDATKASQLPPEFADAKKRLAELLDITDEEARRRQVAMVEKTKEYVNQVESGTGRGRELLIRLDQQYERVKNANRDMGYMTAILGEAIQKAEQESNADREKFAKAQEGESAIGKMQREDRLLAVEEHVQRLGNHLKESIEESANVARSAVQIQSSKAAIGAQSNAMRVMNTRGLASTAGNLNQVLNSINMAALNEATEANRDSLKQMNAKASDIAQKEVIRQAYETAGMSIELEDALTDLANYGDVFKEASAITRQNMEQMRENMAKLRDVREDVMQSIRDASSSQADLVGEMTPTKTDQPGKFGI